MTKVTEFVIRPVTRENLWLDRVGLVPMMERALDRGARTFAADVGHRMDIIAARLIASGVDVSRMRIEDHDDPDGTFGRSLLVDGRIAAWLRIAWQNGSLLSLDTRWADGYEACAAMNFEEDDARVAEMRKLLPARN